MHWIDAGSGHVRKAYDALTPDGPGVGVKGDVKQLDTSVQGGTNVLVSSDRRQRTYDAGSGRNAGCDSVGSDGHQHTADCDQVVPAVGLAVARDTFYTGFTSLQETANMCDARNATVAASPGRYRANVRAAWDAVGVHEGCTGAPPPPPCGDPAATIPFESEHPYANSMDCTWTYDHGSGGYALHFSVLDVERDFDFVTVTDGDGNEVARVTGTFRRGFTTPCITTPVSTVNLRSDGSVVAQGFVVDAAVACG